MMIDGIVAGIDLILRQRTAHHQITAQVEVVLFFFCHQRSFHLHTSNPNTALKNLPASVTTLALNAPVRYLFVMTQNSGYSKRSLIDKLGLKSGQGVHTGCPSWI